ncbi:MAG TPA: PIN domain-containing protein [Candidatus Saccharimonadales bacterium]|nr:PIN domain-containing protein [Candidatus Saccharimonadales bacterium]
MIGLDSNLFVYMLEGHAEFGEAVRDIFVAIEQTRLEACASELVYFEVLSYPGLLSKQVTEATALIGQLGIRYIPVSSDVLLEAARLRRECGLGALDSVHVASALGAGCSAFITNDQALLKKAVPEIRLVALDKAAVLL